MPRAIDQLRENTIKFVSCVAKLVYSDEEENHLEIIEVLDGNPNLLGDSFKINTEDFELSEKKQLFKAELEITAQGPFDYDVKCLAIEEYTD